LATTTATRTRRAMTWTTSQGTATESGLLDADF
jgi:hypothetical protein